MTSNIHTEHNDKLASYALTALDAQECRDLAAHLETCADCRSELEKWNETAALLALAAQPSEPGPELRSRILHGTRAILNRDQNQTKPVLMHPSREWRLPRSWQALAASIIGLVLCLGLLLLWRENSRNRQEVARIAEQMREMNQQISNNQQLITILTTPGARRVELTGTTNAPAARATVAYDATGRTVLLARGLPAVPQGKAYQLWFLVGEKAIPGAVFAPGVSGEAFLSDQAPEAALSPSAFAITLEPESGARSPTGAIYLSMALAIGL